MLLIVQEISRKKNLTIPGVGKHIIIDNFQICLRLWAPTQLRMDMVGLKSFFPIAEQHSRRRVSKLYPMEPLPRISRTKKILHFGAAIWLISLHFLSESRLNQRTPYNFSCLAFQNTEKLFATPSNHRDRDTSILS